MIILVTATVWQSHHLYEDNSHRCAWRNVGREQYRCTLAWPTPKIPSVENIPPTTVDQNVSRSVGSTLKLQFNIAH